MLVNVHDVHATALLVRQTNIVVACTAIGQQPGMVCSTYIWGFTTHADQACRPFLTPGVKGRMRMGTECLGAQLQMLL